MYKQVNSLHIMNKKFWIIAAMCSALCAACNNEVDEIISQPATDNDWITPDGKVIVQLGAQSYDAGASVTRAPLETLSDAELGIFALNKGNNPNWTDGSDPDYNCLLNNIKGTVPVLENGENIVDGTNASKIALWNTEATREGSIYYYPMNNKYLYNFYAYAPWQDTGVAVTANSATVTFNINGSQDIIYASATAKPQTVLTSPDITNNSTENIDGYQAKYIRKIKYHNEINDGREGTYPDLPYIPVLNFEHKLTQLKFNIIAATDQCQEDIENAKLLSVKDIKMVNVNSEAKLDIIRGTFEWGESKTLPMQFSDANLTEPIFSIEGSVEGTIAGKDEEIGYTMLQPELTSYDLQLTIIPPVPTANQAQQPEEQTLTLTIKQANGAPFEAGKSYTVKIALYAMQKVKIEATLSDWEDVNNPIVLPVE